MGRRPALWVIAAAVVASGCIPRTYNTVPTGGAPVGASGSAATSRPAPRPLSPAEQRVQQLEAQLAERDREIAAVQGEIQNARQQPAPPAPPAAAGNAPAAGAVEPPSGAAGAPTGASATAAAAKDAQLAAAQRQISTLEARLEGEVQRRKQVESEMARLLEETSAGPYERTGNVVDQHLREQLAGAQREIADLRTTLTTERRERSDIEKRFAALQAQLERNGSGTGNDSEEVAALKERQRRVVASIQQDLLASQQREAELRASLERTEGSDGVSLADNVTSLRAENAALQRRLDQEHQQNRELSSKLKLAGRVTDLIFKMQSSGAGDAVQQ